MLHKEEIKKNASKILHKCIPEELISLTQYYLLVCFEAKDSRDKWEIVVWDLVSFDRYSKVIKAIEFLPYI